jgi:hypothetical protein
MQLIIKEILVYYDEPQIVVAVDAIETRYLCVHAQSEIKGSIFCCVPISPSRLAAFKSGDLDLRVALTERETISWFEALASESTHVPMHSEQQVSEIPEIYLPDSGFFLENEVAADLVASVAKSRVSLVVEMSLDPPESAYHKISARTLSSALFTMQQVLKYSQVQVHKLLPTAGASRNDSHVLDVLAFNPGSFIVQFEPRASLDLFGSSDLEEALSLIGKLFERVGQPDSAVEAFSPYRGHLIKSIVALLTLITNARSNLGLSWATPNFAQAHKARITRKDALCLLELLAKHKDLSVERVSVSGQLTKADEKNSTWRVFDEATNVEVHGKIRRNASASLAGLVIQKRYRIDCEEEFHQDQVTGRDVRRLFAVEFTEL